MSRITRHRRVWHEKTCHGKIWHWWRCNRDRDMRHRECITGVVCNVSVSTVCTALHCTVQCSTVLYCLYCTVLYSIVLYCGVKPSTNVVYKWNFLRENVVGLEFVILNSVIENVELQIPRGRICDVESWLEWQSWCNDTRNQQAAGWLDTHSFACVLM